MERALAMDCWFQHVIRPGARYTVALELENSLDSLNYHVAA